MSTTHKPRLAVDVRMVDHSGIGTCIKNIVPRLAAEGGIEITLLGNREKLSRFDWFDPARFVPLRSSIYGFKEQAELPSRIPASDIFWSPHFNIPVLPIRPQKRLVTICDVFHLAHFHTLPLAQKLYAKVVLEAAVRLSHKVLTISEFSAREIRKYLPAVGNKLEVVTCGSDPDYPKGAASESPKDRYLLFVGNVKPNKNLKGALAGFFKVAARYPDLKFYIVGRKEGFITGDPEVADLVAGEMGKRVVFTGFIPDAQLKAYYRNSAALFFTSLYEGFGLPLLEAMSFGVPVVSSDRASMPEVGGDAILYFDPADPESMRMRLEEVLDGRWRPDSEKYRVQLAKFNWDNMASRYLEIIRELAFGKELAHTAA